MMLSPASIIRCYTLTGEADRSLSSTAHGQLPGLNNSTNPLMKRLTYNPRAANATSLPALPGSTIVPEENDESVNWVLENRPELLSTNTSEIVTVKSMLDYINSMNVARRKAAQLNLVPLYHFTNPNVVSLIMKDGVRMSTQGQGDGGVYFSTQGPASYNIGSSKYEENIIKDCFGVFRMAEYRGQGKLNALIVYGISPLILQHAPGGRDHAKFVPRLFLESISLPGYDGNFFLRPDNILSVMIINADKKPSRANWYVADLELEKDLDIEVETSLSEFEKKGVNNNQRMTSAMKSVDLLLEEVEEEDEEEEEAPNLEERDNDHEKFQGIHHIDSEKSFDEPATPSAATAAADINRSGELGSMAIQMTDLSSRQELNGVDV
jgi:hypothetical protein